MYIPETSGASRAVHRIATWEDGLQLHHLKHAQQGLYSRPPSSLFSPPLAIRTVQRPVKAWWFGENAMAPMIEKSASTLLDVIFKRAGATGGHCRCENRPSQRAVADAIIEAAAQPASRRCCGSGTFVHDAISNRSVYRFAFVRDPLDRFLSGMRPHSPWVLCGKQVCAEDAAALRRHAAALAAHTAHSFEVANLPNRRTRTVASAHWYTQSYFLSATDATGRPLLWDHIGRVERVRHDLQSVATHVGGLSAALLTMAGNDSSRGGHAAELPKFNANGLVQEHERAILRASVLGEPQMACDFCTVHLQDYACLGYPLPAECTACTSKKWAASTAGTRDGRKSVMLDTPTAPSNVNASRPPHLLYAVPTQCRNATLPDSIHASIALIEAYGLGTTWLLCYDPPPYAVGSVALSLPACLGQVQGVERPRTCVVRRLDGGTENRPKVFLWHDVLTPDVVAPHKWLALWDSDIMPMPGAFDFGTYVRALELNESAVGVTSPFVKNGHGGDFATARLTPSSLQTIQSASGDATGTLRPVQKVEQMCPVYSAAFWACIQPHISTDGRHRSGFGIGASLHGMCSQLLGRGTFLVAQAVVHEDSKLSKSKGSKVSSLAGRQKAKPPCKNALAY